MGDLLWRGTLKQDYFLVLAAATGFAVLSSILLALQGFAEVGTALMVRRSPRVEGAAPAAADAKPQVSA